MISGLELCEFIEKGGVLTDVEGSTPQEVYRNVIDAIKLPEGIDRELVYTELCEREKVLSTAVGNGIAIPHPRRPLMKNAEDQRIVRCAPQKKRLVAVKTHLLHRLESISGHIHFNGVRMIPVSAGQNASAVHLQQGQVSAFAGQDGKVGKTV